MGNHIFDGILAFIALAFALLEFSYSNIVVIIATALILIHALAHLLGICNCGCKEINKLLKPETKKPTKNKGNLLDLAKRSKDFS